MSVKIKLGCHPVRSYGCDSRLWQVENRSSSFPYRDRIRILHSIVIEADLTLQFVTIRSLNTCNDIKIILVGSENPFRLLHSGTPVHSR